MTTIPKIRFSGFVEEWEEMDFSEIAQRRSNSEISNDKLPYVEFEDINSGEGTLNKDLFEKDGCKRGILFSKGDVLFGKLRPYLKNILYADFKGIAVGDFWVLHSDVLDSNLLYTLVNSATFMQVANISSGSKMPRADWNLVSSSSFCIPPTISEQRRLSHFFTLIDEHIRLEGERLASLRQVKAASLQSFFPQEGEKEPRVRFKGFSGEWKRVRLGEIAKRITRKNINMESNLPLTISSIDGLVSQIDYFNNRVASQNICGYYLIKKGEYAYNKSYSNGYPWGSVKRLDKYDNGVLSTLYIVFSINDSIDSDYFSHYFNTSLWYKEVAGKAEEGARNHGLLNISVEDFFDINIIAPPTLSEQCRLSHFFTNLDEQIRLLGEKIEKMKRVKGACLEGMMV